MNLVLRPFSESARAFVADSFVRSYQGGDSPLAWADAVTRGQALRRWLAGHWDDVRLLTGDDPDLFLGWLMIARPGVAWYCYVKHDVRHKGLAREALRMADCQKVLLTNHAWQEEWNG